MIEHDGIMTLINLEDAAIIAKCPLTFDKNAEVVIVISVVVSW